MFPLKKERKNFKIAQSLKAFITDITFKSKMKCSFIYIRIK